MKVTLVCTSGITTGMLASKLNKYAKDHQYEDVFRAIRINAYADFLKTSDVFLVAPQAKPVSLRLVEEADHNQIPIIFLTEADMVFADVDRIYSELKPHRLISVSIRPESQLSLWTILMIIANAMLRCLPFLILGILAVWLPNINESVLYDISFGMFSFYFAYAIGYEYGEFVGRNRLSYGLLFLASSTFALQTDFIRVNERGIIAIRDGFIPLLEFNATTLLTILLVSLLTMLTLYLMRHIHRRYFERGNEVSHQILEMPLINGTVFVVLLLVRYILFNRSH